MPDDDYAEGLTRRQIRILRDRDTCADGYCGCLDCPRCGTSDQAPTEADPEYAELEITYTETDPHALDAIP